MSYYGNVTPYCPDARKILREEDGNLLKVYDYLMEVACHHTWVVGRFRRISEQGLKELLEVSGCNGRKRKPGTRGQVRSVLTRLQKIGVIIELESFVFSLPYEQAYFSAQKRYNHRSTQGSAEQITPEVVVLNGESDDQDGEVNTRYNRRYNPPLINQSINKTSADYFRMSMDWVPSEKFVEVAKMSGFDAKAADRGLMLEALADQRVFWTLPETLENPKYKHERSQSAWEQALLKKMVYLKNSPQQRASITKGVARGQGSDEFTVPKDNDGLVSWAAKHGYPASGALSFFDYRGLLYKAVDARKSGKTGAQAVDPLIAKDQERRRAMAEQAKENAAKAAGDANMKKLLEMNNG